MNTSAEQFFLRVLETYARIPRSEWQKLQPKLKTLYLERNQLFIRQGEVSTNIGFIVSGVFRVFCTTREGSEKTLAFRSEGQFLSALTPLIEKRDCWYSIQALEQGELLYIGNAELAGLPEVSDTCWDKVFRKYIVQLYIEKEARERSFLTEDAQTRYLEFVHNYPDLEKRVHNFHIASYLGMSDVTLSRIRGELRGSTR